jgi:sugar phosphate isomerase/epimerase
VIASCLRLTFSLRCPVPRASRLLQEQSRNRSGTKGGTHAMDKHWGSYCAMSVVHFMAFPSTATGEGPIAETVRMIAEDDFFDAIEIAWIKDAAARRQVRRIIEVSQLQVGFCAHPAILSQKLNLNSLNENERLAALDMMKELIDQACELGASSFVFLSGPDPGKVDREAALQALVDSVAQMCEYGQKQGVRMTLETFDRRVDKKALIGPVSDASRLAETVRGSYQSFGLLYDLSHMPILDETPADMTVIKQYLTHVHIGNCVTVEGQPRYGDAHPYIGFPGGANDVGELASFVRGLFRIGYLAKGKDPKPWVGFEVKPQGPVETPELIISSSKRAWRQAWSCV